MPLVGEDEGVLTPHKAGRLPMLDRTWEVLIHFKTGIDGVSGLKFTYSATEALGQTSI